MIKIFIIFTKRKIIRVITPGGLGLRLEIGWWQGCHGDRHLSDPLIRIFKSTSVVARLESGAFQKWNGERDLRNPF